MKTAAVLVAVALLAAGCGGGQGTEDVVVVGAEQALPQESSPLESAPASSAAAPADQPTPSTTQTVPAGPGGLARCDDVSKLESRLEGTLSGRQNPDQAVTSALSAYGRQHPATYAGLWIDRDNGGVLMVGFTDDPERHRAAILARRPSPDDDPEGDGSPITDDRPLGGREDVVIDVVQVRFSEADVRAVRDQMSRAIPGQDWMDLGLDATAYDIESQRVTLHLVNPPEGALEELGDRLPDPSAACVSISVTPEPPAGPLNVIPDPDVEDPLVRCPGTPAVPYSRLIDPPSIDDVEHPAVDVLRAELETPGGEPLPRGRWVVINIDDDLAIFAALSSSSFGTAAIERRGDRWILGGHGGGRACEPVVAMPPGLARVEVRIDPDSPPDPAEITIHLLVTERGCASGREMGDALRGPQIVETGKAVLVAFAVIPVAGSARCPGNPSTSVTIELSEPLGDRTLYDGLHYPPKPLTAESR